MRWGIIAALVCCCFCACNSQTNKVSFDADKASQEVTEVLLSDPSTAAKAQELGDKDVALTRFQQANNISDDIAEAAIKEWVLTHNGNFDWALGDVEKTCLKMSKEEN
jgi:hypothetical protein